MLRLVFACGGGNNMPLLKKTVYAFVSHIGLGVYKRAVAEINVTKIITIKPPLTFVAVVSTVTNKHIQLNVPVVSTNTITVTKNVTSP